MKATGLVLKPRSYVGGVPPPATVLEDESRYGSNGDFASSGHPNWVKRPSGLWALDFDPATPDYIEISAATTRQLNFTSEDFSIIMRVYPDAIATNPRLFQRGENLVDGWSFVLFEAGQVYFYTFQSGAWQQTVSTAGDISTGAWYTVGASRVGASARTYVNGVDTTDVAGSHINPVTCARSAKIGIFDDLTLFAFDGMIAYLAIWNYALSAIQHSKMHYALKGWV